MRLPAQSLTTLLSAALTSPSATQMVALLLVIVLLGASAAVWAALLIRSQYTGIMGLDWVDEPRSDWRLLSELTVVGLTLLLICLHLAPKFGAAADETPPTLEPSATKAEHEPAPTKPVVLTVNHLINHTVFTGGLTAVLLAFLVFSGRSPAEYGFKEQSPAWQIADGVTGYLLALWPMAAMMFATAMFRTKETRNSLLTLLAETSDPWTILLIAFAAVVIAPLYEELMFRVVLQGWLTTFIKPAVAIPLVAVIFGAIHGLPDGIALLPLAVVLGYVFDRRHSYLSVVVIHSLFNATMLSLALLGQG